MRRLQTLVDSRGAAQIGVVFIIGRVDPQTKIFSNNFSGGVGFGGVLSVAATSVYGMDHTGDSHRHDGEPGHDAGPDVDAVSGVDVPVESGHRSQALLVELAEAERARIHAEARVSQLIVEIDQARASEAAGQHSDPRIQTLEAASAADDMSLDLGLTAGAVAHRIDEYTFVQTHMPLLWARHQDGRIDAWRLHIIAETTRDTLTDPASYTVLDEKLAAWLDGRATFTPGQLRAWLRRTVARLEPDNQRERTRRCWAQRSARITHDDDGTAQLFSVLSSEDGIAIDDLINQLARARAQNTDGVTIQQARADIIADLLLGRTSLEGEDTGTTRVQARIAVMVPITTLAGRAEGQVHCAHSIRSLSRRSRL